MSIPIIPSETRSPELLNKKWNDAPSAQKQRAIVLQSSPSNAKRPHCPRIFFVVALPDSNRNDYPQWQFANRVLTYEAIAC
jgi:hypothetical protein